MELIIDINSDLFDVKVGERITMALASTLALDGFPDDGKLYPFSISINFRFCL